MQVQPDSPFRGKYLQLTNARTAECRVTGSATALDSRMISATKDRGPTSISSASQMRQKDPPLHNPQRVPSANETDVSEGARADGRNKVRQKFNDIFEVSDRCHEFGYYDIENAKDDFSVAGRLSRPEFIEFFKEIGASEFILNTLRYGHYPSLIADVPNFERDNNNSFSKEHLEFGMGEIKKLIDSGKVEIVSQKPKIVNPLSVAVHPKLRLILDCSFLNKFITVPSFKMDDYKTALSLFESDNYLFSFDMKDGYHHLLIHEDFRDYLGFKFVLDGRTVYARYVVAPFGLRDIPFLFTKILRPLVGHWRRKGIKICLYLDDGFSSAKTYEEALQNSIHVRQDLMRAGVVWNVKKSCWLPRKSLEWVGFVWDSAAGTLKIREKRIVKLKNFLKELCQEESCTTRKLAAVVGQVISMQAVVGDITRLKTRTCLIQIASSEGWDRRIRLSSHIKKEFLFWLENIDRLNIRYCFQLEKPVVFSLIESDASSTGCGSILNGTHVAAKIFEEQERKQSSTHREIANIHFSLLSFLPNIQNKSVTVKTDSQSAAKICKVGSMKTSLQSFAEAIFELCFNNNINLVADWIPRAQNKDADFVSRLADEIDIDDWQISQSFFDILDKRWGPFTIDLFANYYNTKCERFYSLFYSPSSLGVNAFRYDWSNENSLMVPPIPLISDTLNHARLCKGRGTLIVPLWPTASFWPVLMGDFEQYIADLLVVKGTSVLLQGKNTKSIFGSNSFQGKMIAIKLEFT